MKTTFTKKQVNEDAVKAMKALNRQEYGFQPTRIAENRKRYKRCRDKWHPDKDANFFYLIIWIVS